jgi:hypothetical protein
MKRAQSKRIWTLLLACLVMGPLACTDPDPTLTKTQVTLRLRAPSDALRTTLTELRVRVYRPSKSGWELASQASIGASRLRWPLDVPILPASPAESGAAFEVVVDAYAGNDRSAQARAVSGFAPNALRLLELSLYECAETSGGACAMETCHGAGCGTCGASGRCEPVSVTNPSTLAVYDPQRAPEDQVESAPVDAGERIDAAPVIDAAPIMDAAPVLDTAVPNDAPVSAPALCDAGCDAAPPAPACGGSCPAARPVCDTVAQTCVECTGDPHCPSDKRFCVEQRCIACRSPADCAPPANQCISGTCSVACTMGADIVRVCDKDFLVERDSCGQTVAVRSGCCGRGCTGAACNPPDPRASMGCYMGNAHYIDSCNDPGELIKDCCGAGCSNGVCANLTRKVCVNGDSYSEDYCGTRRSLIEACSCGRGCNSSTGECNPLDTRASLACQLGHVYWLDSCGKQSELAQDCQGRGCVGSNCNP